MARSSEFSKTNMELHRRWKELCDREDQESRSVIQAKSDLANEVIEANRRLLGAEIRMYTKRNPQLEPDLFDTAGAELWRAFKMWDPERGTLRTVAMPYIRGAVRREVARNDHPHLSYDDFTLRSKVLNANREFELRYEREPTADELSEVSGVPADKIAILFAGNPLSLDQPANGSDEDMTLGAIVASQTAEDSSEEEELLAEFGATMEPEVLEEISPQLLMAYLMRQGTVSSTAARTAEVSYMLGLPNNGRTAVREIAQVSMRNAYVKLQKITGETPTPEQVSILANVSVSQAERFLQDA